MWLSVGLRAIAYRNVFGFTSLKSHSLKSHLCTCKLHGESQKCSVKLSFRKKNKIILIHLWDLSSWRGPATYNRGDKRGLYRERLFETGYIWVQGSRNNLFPSCWATMSVPSSGRQSNDVFQRGTQGFMTTCQLTHPVLLRSYSMLSRDNHDESTKGLSYRHTFILWIRVEKITVMFRIELFGNDLYPHWPKLSCSLAWSAILRWWGVRANDANKLPWLILTDLLAYLTGHRILKIPGIFIIV